MNCEELKKQLAEKDAQVKARTENTIKCFNLIKDWIVDDLIKRTIDDEFIEHGQLIYAKCVYREMFKKLDIDVSKLYWYEASIHTNNDLEYMSYITKGLAMMWSSDGRRGGYDCEDIESVNQYEAVRSFMENFDAKLFKHLIFKHVRDFGFWSESITNRWGEKRKSNFLKISRERLENKCCGNPKVEDEQRESSENIWSGILVVIAIAIIAFVYAMS